MKYILTAGDNMIYRECETPKCFFCAYSAQLAATEDMICSKAGIVHENSVCKKFRYDPQKRVPKRTPKLNTEKFSAKDFAL